MSEDHEQVRTSEVSNRKLIARKVGPLELADWASVDASSCSMNARDALSSTLPCTSSRDRCPEGRRRSRSPRFLPAPTGEAAFRQRRRLAAESGYACVSCSGILFPSGNTTQGVYPIITADSQHFNSGIQTITRCTASSIVDL